MLLINNITGPGLSLTKCACIAAESTAYVYAPILIHHDVITKIREACNIIQETENTGCRFTEMQCMEVRPGL